MNRRAIRKPCSGRGTRGRVKRLERRAAASWASRSRPWIVAGVKGQGQLCPALMVGRWGGMVPALPRLGGAKGSGPSLQLQAGRGPSPGPKISTTTYPIASAYSPSTPLMALRELPFRAASGLCREVRPALHVVRPTLRRNASAAPLQEIEDSSSFTVPPPSKDLVQNFDPIARSRLRRQGKKQLPASRYCIPNGSIGRPN